MKNLMIVLLGILSFSAFSQSPDKLWYNQPAKHFEESLVLPENTGNWHYWTQATVGEIIFSKEGLNLLTLKYNKGANLAFFDFLLVEAY